MPDRSDRGCVQMTRCGIQPSHSPSRGHSRPEMGVGSYARRRGQHGAPSVSGPDPGDIVNVGHVVDIGDMHTVINPVERGRLKS